QHPVAALEVVLIDGEFALRCEVQRIKVAADNFGEPVDAFRSLVDPGVAMLAPAVPFFESYSRFGSARGKAVQLIAAKQWTTGYALRVLLERLRGRPRGRGLRAERPLELFKPARKVCAEHVGREPPNGLRQVLVP